MVERLEPLAGLRPTDDDPALVDRGGVERVDGLAQLEHHVVRGVHHVAHGPLAGRQETHLDAVRRRTDLDAAHPAAHEARAQVRIEDVDPEPLGRRSARLGHIGPWQAQRPARGRGDLACQADDRERVATVRLDVDVEDDLAEELGERAAERRVRRQDEDPLAIGGHPQLFARAEHAVAHDSHLLGALDPPVARQDRAGQGDRDPLAGRDVGRAADDLERFAVADRDTGEREAVGARVALHRQQLPGDDVAPVLTPLDDAFDLHPEQGQALRERLRGQVDIDDLAQPAERHPHRNCSRKRRSLSRKSRRSVMPCLSILIRSGPIPNAKPW